MWIVAIVALLFGWLSEGVFAGLAAAGLTLALSAWLEVAAAKKQAAAALREAQETRALALTRISELTARMALLELDRTAPALQPVGSVSPQPVPMPEPEAAPVWQPTITAPLPSEISRTAELASTSAPTPESSWAYAPPAVPAATVVPVVPPRVERADSVPPPPFVSPEERLRRWLLGDNPVARAGVLVLLVGVALLLRLAAEHRLFPIEARLGCVALGGTWLTVFGFRQRAVRPTFSQLLQGAGIATLYMVVFFAYRSFQLLPSSLAFALLVAVVIASGVLAVLQDSLSLVFIGTVGGFAAPILASSGSGNHVALFSYYLVLDVLVLGVAWFKEWRLLTYTGFLATFGVATAWGALRYDPALFASTEPFLLGFFAIYVAINLLSAVRRPDSLRGGLSASLTFGLPLVTLGLQTVLAAERDWIVASTALGMGALYFVLARTLLKRSGDAQRSLVDGYIALSVGLATLSVPFALDSKAMVSATWVLEAAGLYWVGVRSQRLLARLVSIALLLAGVVAAAGDGVWRGLSADSLPLLNASSLCALLLLAAGLFMAAVASRNRERLPGREPALVQALIPFAVYLSAIALENEVDARFAPERHTMAFLALSSLLAGGLAALGARLSLTGARWTALVSLLVVSAGLALDREAFSRVLWAEGGALAYPLMLLGNGLVLHMQGTRREWPVRAGHVLFPLWLTALALCAAWDLVARTLLLASGWSSAVLGLGLGVAVAVVAHLSQVAREPFATFAPELRLVERVLSAGALTCWLLCLTSRGVASPLPFVPLLNPLELVMVGLFGQFVWLSRRALEALPAEERAAWAQGRLAALGALAFLGLNAMLARAVHHFVHVPYSPHALSESDVFQVGLSVLWSSLGLAGTVWSSRRARREVWLVACTLLAVVVLKLFFVDLAQVGPVARILSFLAVGALLLAVGYLAPLPPARGGHEREAPP